MNRAELIEHLDTHHGAEFGEAALDLTDKELEHEHLLIHSLEALPIINGEVIMPIVIPHKHEGMKLLKPDTIEKVELNEDQDS